MGKQYKAISAPDAEFIRAQKMFFTASCSGAEVNLSPKGYDCLRILDESSALYLDYPGSGDRLARDIRSGGQVTLMFCAFQGPAKIVRLFCEGELVEKSGPRFAGWMKEHFGSVSPEIIRRLVLLKVYAVESSCGEGVPYFEYQGEREELRHWAAKTHASGKLDAYITSHLQPVKLR